MLTHNKMGSFHMNASVSIRNWTNFLKLIYYFKVTGNSIFLFGTVKNIKIIKMLYCTTLNL